MIEQAVAIRQSLRLSGLISYPQVPEAQLEIAKALERSSRNPEHAARIVSELLRSFRFCPTPADIYDVAQRTDSENNPIEWTCAACHGTGWEPCFELITWRGGSRKDVQTVSKEQYEHLKHQVSGQLGDQVTQEAVRRCLHCAVGRRRAEAEKNDDGA